MIKFMGVICFTILTLQIMNPRNMGVMSSRGGDAALRELLFDVEIHFGTRQSIQRAQTT